MEEWWWMEASGAHETSHGCVGLTVGGGVEFDPDREMEERKS
jgi:hypothetical protein